MPWDWRGGYSGGATSGGSTGGSVSEGASGGGGGDSWGFWGSIASAMLSGVGSSSRARAERESSRESAMIDAISAERQVRLTGDEQRRTIDFESRTNEANRLNERARMGRAWTAWGKGDNSKPAAQPVLGPDFRSYYVEPEQMLTPDGVKPTKPTKPNKG
jgi:hypothetical protein